MLKQHWKPAAAIAIASVLVIVVSVVSIAAYSHARSARVIALQSAAQKASPAGSNFFYASPYATALPYYGYAYAGNTPNYGSYPNYGTYPSNSNQVGIGYGPPHNGSISDIPSAPNCGQGGYDPYGPCGFGPYTYCQFDLNSPYCNQQLSNGARCGYGYGGCVQVQLTCRLPIFGGGPGSGGFVDFPKGEFASEPSSNVTAPNGQTYGGSYDRAAAKWLPVPRAWVSPNGSEYAYADGTGVVHSVAVTQGTDTKRTTSGSWQVLSYQSEGVYAVPTGSAPGLWLIPDSGAPKQITATGYWQLVGGGAAYGNISANYPSGASNQVLRLDLRTGTSSPWFQRPGDFSTVVGIDQGGHAIVQASSQSGPNGQAELWVVVNAASAIKVVEGFQTDTTALSDQHGLWMSVRGPNSQGTFLLTEITDSAGGNHPIFDRVSTVVGQFAAADCR